MNFLSLVAQHLQAQDLPPSSRVASFCLATLSLLAAICLCIGPTVALAQDRPEPTPPGDSRPNPNAPSDPKDETDEKYDTETALWSVPVGHSI